MTENQIAKLVLDHSIKIHKEYGPGLLENIYEHMLFDTIKESGLMVYRQYGLPILFRGKNLGNGFRADLIVENKVIIEVKSIESLAPVHFKQVLTYLKVSELKLGLLINFNEAKLTQGFKRVVNNL